MKYWAEIVWQDLRYGIRMLVRNPVFSLVMVLTLGLGIGANTVLFSIVNGVLLRPLPFAHPAQLVTIENPWHVVNYPQEDPTQPPQPAENNLTLENTALYNSGEVNFTDGLVPVRVLIIEASASYFSTLGINPLQGRTYGEAEEKQGQNRVAVLSWGFWQSRYAGDPKVLSRIIAINGRNFTIIGVMPRSFQFPAYPGNADLWVPLTPAEHLIASEGISYNALARIKGGVTLSEAQAEMDVIFHRLNPNSKDPNDPNRIQLIPLRKMFESGTRPALLVLLGSAGFVLLIACANIANLSLTRAVGRQRDIAVRSALGAARSRLAGQWLTESVLLALMGGAVGLLLTFWSLKALVFVGSFYLRYATDVSVDFSVLLFTVMISIATGIFFGLAPAIQFSNPDLTESLKEGPRMSSGFSRSLLRRGLIVVEVALALILLTGAGLLLRTFENLWRVDPGFNPHNVLTLELSASKTKYPTQIQNIAFYQRVIDQIKAIPGINAAGSVNHLPLNINDTSTFFAGLIFYDRNSRPNKYPAAYRVVSPDYFKVMGVPMLRGRNFTDQDAIQSPSVAIINQSLANRAFGKEDPIGQHFSWGSGKTDRTFEIIGVVGDIRHWGLGLEAHPEFYGSSLQLAAPFVTIAISSKSNVGQISSAIRRALDQVDKDLPISNLRAMDNVVAESLSERRFVMILLGLFSALALLLSAVGIYGVISYSISSRIQEIGVRMALGAQPRNVLTLILGQGLTLVMSGIGLGIFASIWLTRLLTSYLFDVRPMDPFTLVAVSVILTGVAILACYLPARRAMNVDPVVALRHE